MTKHMLEWFRWRAIEQMRSTPGPKYCDRCGAANDPQASYCAGCGQALNY